MFNADTLIVRLLQSQIVSDKNGMVGCTDQQIASIESFTGLVLPRAYVEFLSVAGQGAGRFMEDVDVFYPHMLGLNSEATRILASWERDRLILPDKSFVFSMRLKEQFQFFIADRQSDNPEVYYYQEDAGRFEIIGRFWEVLESEVLVVEQWRRNCPNSVPGHVHERDGTKSVL